VYEPPAEFLCPTPFATGDIIKVVVFDSDFVSANQLPTDERLIAYQVNAPRRAAPRRAVAAPPPRARGWAAALLGVSVGRARSVCACVSG
jgi:hypothetical protein